VRARFLHLTRERGLLILALDRPPENRLTPSLLEEFDEALDLLDSSMDAAVVTGTGAVFSYGFDLEVIRSWTGAGEARRDIEAGNRVLARLARSTKPTIAAINGHCFGGGLEIALACQFRLCAAKVRMGLPELTSGLLPGLGGISRLAALVGRAKALELIALGDLITAEEAYRLNLVNRILPRDAFLDRVKAFARTLLMVDPELLRETIRLLGLIPEVAADAGIRDAIDSFIRLLPFPPPNKS
jgi:enoyl-CoA hydratase/carnithine racemase